MTEKGSLSEQLS